MLPNRTPSSLVVFRGQRVLPGPVRTDSTGTRRSAVVGKLGATVLPDSGSTTSLGRWGQRVLPGPGSWRRPDPFYGGRVQLSFAVIASCEPGIDGCC